MDKQHEEIRRQFEEWFNGRYSWKITPTMRTDSGYSNNPRADSMWGAWQASRASTEIFQRENGYMPQRRWSKEAEMREAWCIATTHNEWKEQVVEAARKFVNCKGRYHSEQNMTALIEIFRQEPEKP